MKFSEQWLREWVNPDLATEALAEQLTLAGLEVEAVAPAAPDLRGIVAGRVETVEKHPAADRLAVCTVKKDQGEPVTVVTGAPGVAPGHCYPYIGAGVALPGGAAVREVKLRGVKSSGMLCSAAELGLAEEAESLFLLPPDSRPGTPLPDLLGLDDCSFTVSLTPNRGDCLSIQGMAREAAALNGAPLTPPLIEPAPAAHEQARAVRLEAAADCPRYVGRIICDVDAAAPTPLWMQEKLRRCGVRGLGALVDVTNYVMLELGQPMHAFDNDRLRGDIVVRRAAANEELTLLDGGARTLPEGALVIADETRPVAVAGVMGGQDSAVSEATRCVFLESAFFTPAAVAGRARQLGLQSEAAHRFERGVDFTLQRRAMERATQLVLELCGGSPGPLAEAVEEDALPPPRTVELGPTAVADLLGETIAAERCGEILARLGLEETPGGAAGRLFRVPPHRFDLAIEADLVEEIARVHGYQEIAGVLPPSPAAMRPAGERERLGAVRLALAARGYQEAVTYSFVSAELQSLLFPGAADIALVNAISPDSERMRLSLWPGLTTALRRNVNRQQLRARLFEVGKVFAPEQGRARQETAVGGLLYGSALPPQWGAAAAPGDFYDLKSDVEAVLAACCERRGLAFEAVEVAALHQGKAAAVVSAGRRVGLLGALHPKIQSRLGLEEEVCLFEIYLERLPAREPPRIAAVSRFPLVRRDLSVIVDGEVPLDKLLKDVREAVPSLLTNLDVLDVYRGKPVAPGEKSVTLGLTFQQTSSTLTDEEVEGLVSRALASLHKNFEARLRD